MGFREGIRRQRFCFWLDSEKEDEFALAEQIVNLKKARRFVTTVRDGIWLMLSLREGEWDVLNERFPRFRGCAA